MANPGTAATLYHSVSKLAYVETKMSIDPRPPFGIEDGDALDAQVARLDGCAETLRRKSEAALNQSEVFEAQEQVDLVLTMFDVINTHPVNSYAVTDVTSAVDLAMVMVNAL